MRIDKSAFNEVYRPYVRESRRYQIFFGGSSSGKSAFLASRCVLDALWGRNVLIVRKVARTLRPSCWNEVLKAMGRLRVRKYFDVSQSEMLITAKQSGGQLIFAGLDDVEKIKSITPAHGVLTDVWMEEATECRYSDYKQLDKRLRGVSVHAKRMTFSFNPIARTHWLYEEFFSGWQDGAEAFPPPARCGRTVPGRSYFSDNLCILKTTYRDNRFLTYDDRKALENEQDPYYYDVYTRGAWGVSGDVVFRSWRAEDLSQTAARFPDKRYGLDFGFAKDPAACIRCAVSEGSRTVYIFAELLERGLTTWELAERLKRFAGDETVTCDSAEPRSIAELRRLGIHARPARKGPDSVLHGLQWLRGYQIVVDPSCRNMIRELSQYRWKEDSQRLGRPVPEGEDHLIDALRYALEDEQLARRAALGRKGGLIR